MSKYYWRIFPHIGPDVIGPHDADQTITANKAKFQMYDDDGICWYRGEIYGEYDGFEPLDDFGGPNDGCTAIKINGEWL